MIQKRSEKKESNPGMWTLSCAGHVPSGASSLETAVRELKEELGLIANAKNLKFIYSYKREKDKAGYKSRHILDVFLLVHDVNLLELKLQDEEVSKAILISIDEYRKKINQKDSSFIDYSDELEPVLKEFET